MSGRACVRAQVDADTLSLVSYFWTFERRWAITRGPRAVLHAVWAQVLLFAVIAGASMAGEAMTHGVEDLATINNMLLNLAIVSAVMVIFNGARLAAAKRLSTDRAALDCLLTVTRPGMPLYADPTFAPRFGDHTAGDVGDGEESVDSAVLRRPQRRRRRGESVELHPSERGRGTTGSSVGGADAGAVATRVGSAPSGVPPPRAGGVGSTSHPKPTAAGAPRRQRSRRSSSRGLGPGVGSGPSGAPGAPIHRASSTRSAVGSRPRGLRPSDSFEDHEPFGDI